jgi:chemotaxis protein histidine kinase CheA
MMEDLLATFVPKFAANAKVRVARSIELANRRDIEGVAVIVREMHAIAGEAGLLGLSPIVSLARVGEETAKRLRSNSNDHDAEALIASLDELKRAIELVSPPKKPEQGAV